MTDIHNLKIKDYMYIERNENDQKENGEFECDIVDCLSRKYVFDFSIFNLKGSFSIKAHICKECYETTSIEEITYKLGLQRSNKIQKRKNQKFR